MALSTTPLFEFHYECDGRLVVRETHYAENKLVQDGHSGPPLHIHGGQTEYFQVESGTLAVIRNGKKSILTKGGGIIKIPPGTRYCIPSSVSTARLPPRLRRSGHTTFSLSARLTWLEQRHPPVAAMVGASVDAKAVSLYIGSSGWEASSRIRVRLSGV
ncbi:ankyrin repeat domain-containing protein [Fusarium phyllophilum]|uniref:Ankyrin repeat domain-containing protein n=1 Tax=Fusarium phyllophilum TaxID=47803 RepID=A0A8H5IVJ5_9HYPO|nr:ankyrin repeat domain-containing protein [Fusarium phyllophilum]